MPLADPSVLRVEFGDDLFLRRHRGMGAAVVNQFVWRFDEPLSVGEVAGFRDALAEGALARRAERSRVPTSRDRWTRCAYTPAVVRRAIPLTEGMLLPWLRERAAAPLDPHEGRTWELSWAEESPGGSVLTLVVAHAAADGAAMVDAVERATSGSPLPTPPAHSLVATTARDLLDGAGQLRAVVRWARDRLRASAPVASGRPTPSPRSHAPGSADWTVPVVVAEFDEGAAADAAEELGGSTNTWFVAVVADLVRRTERFTPGSSIPLALPVSTRAPRDHRSNTTRIASVRVTPEALDDRDLGIVRATCKRAYTDLAARSGAEPVPLALVQMLPDAVVRRIPAPPAQAALASNMGELSSRFRTIAGHQARSVAGIAHYVAADAEEIRGVGGGVAAWLSTCGDRTTLAVAGMEPDLLADDTELRQLVVDVLATWNVDAEAW